MNAFDAESRSLPSRCRPRDAGTELTHTLQMAPSHAVLELWLGVEEFTRSFFNKIFWTNRQMIITNQGRDFPSNHGGESCASGFRR